LAEPDEADIHRDASLPVIAFICANLSRTRGAAQARPRQLGKALEVAVRCEHHAPRRRVEAQRFTGSQPNAASQTPADSGGVNAEYN
jgi:hypothetical protein